MGINTAQPKDISAIARIHYESLPEDFLPSLGLDFLEEVYYPVVIQSEYAKTFVAFTAKKAVGFVTIAHNGEQFIQNIIKKRLLILVKYVLRTILHNPRYFKKCLEIFWSAVLAKPDPVKGEIAFIAVKQNCRGQGIGKELVVVALNYLRQKGVSRCRTKTLKENTGVIKMYEKMGWKVRNRLNLIGREYVIIVSGTLE